MKMEHIKRVLLIEDQLGPRRIAYNLQSFGFIVECANNLNEAFWYLELDETIPAFDAIILDLNLPSIVNDYLPSNDGQMKKRTINDPSGMNGYEYYKSIFLNEEAVIPNNKKTLLSYATEKRIAFYTGYGHLIREIAENDGISLNGIPIFDKADSNLTREIVNWINELEPVES
ncbi:MAG: hypothetical protein FWG88_10010 [Oscillospiraceae bacterium]|nr:hypothetical protein [Oscillospiraceae bacterium]